MVTATSSKIFVEMRAWFDELSQEEQAQLKEFHAHSIVSTRIIPDEHGPDIAHQLEAGRRRFLGCSDPFCLVRIGDCEIGLLGAGLITDASDLPRQLWHTGFSREAFFLRRAFFHAIGESTLVGLQENWPAIRTHTGTLLRMMGFTLPLSNGIEVHVPYKLLVDGTLFRYLAGKKTLLVGSGASKLRDCLNNPQFLDLHAFLGPLDQMKIAGAIQAPARNAYTDYERIISAAEEIDFDVALISCGGIAKPLAWRLWKKGKTALDVGFVFDALLGNPERQFRPVLRDVQWPPFT